MPTKKEHNNVFIIERYKKVIGMNKKVLITIIAIMILILIGAIVFWIQTEPIVKEDKREDITNTKISVVTSLEDEISYNTVWCGTFNLIWNDLKNDIVKQNIILNPQLVMVENLNKGTFNTSQISEDSYYKVYGHMTKELKEEIEKAIKEKFNETTDILDDFDWQNVDPNDYFLYAMLKKEFEFKYAFTELENGKFGERYENVKYFGINKDTEELVRDQVTVLYYNSKEDFAVKLLTKTDDEIIIVRGNDAKTFKEMYEDVTKREKEYNGSRSFSKKDTLKVPNINFDIKREFKELENKHFFLPNGEKYFIDMAVQTIQFDLDKKGGKIKSEAGMSVKRASAEISDEQREFLVDDEFTIFLKEKGKDLPYFASKIGNISRVQNDVKKILKNNLNENFEMKYYYKKPKNIEKVHTIIDEGETDLYDYNIYSYEGSVNVKIDGKEISLRNALLDDKITMEDIIAKAEKDFPDAIVYKDGGTKEYHYKEYTIIKMNTIDGNEDVYIAKENITLNDIELKED